jgi:autophagy-related protein 33
MTSKTVSVLKFVGTVSLGLLTGVSYTASTISIPSILRLPSSNAAAQAITDLVHQLRFPVVVLNSLAALPLAIAFVLSPRSARHPYLIYTSLLATSSMFLPGILSPASLDFSTTTTRTRPARSSAAHMEASYEVLGDVHSDEATSETDFEEVNGEEVRTAVDSIAKGYAIRGGFAMLGFAMAAIGLWGDGAPRAVVYVS